MLWSEVLKNWENGVVLKYPRQIKGRFLWNTSVLKNDGNTEYKQRFVTNYDLPEVQNKKSFQEYIKNSQNEYVVAFHNLTKDTLLVIPMPMHGKNYVTLKDFIDNAPDIQQQEFWKKVAEMAKKFMKEKGNVWISVHGFGVPYTHVRISSSPKYYFDNELKKKSAYSRSV
jgi:hypothetical protein